MIICPISSAVAAGFVKENHYLHRAPPISYAFALYTNYKLAGCITLGNPPNRRTFEKFGPEYNGLELNRLFVHDWADKNTESFFIGKVLRYINAHIQQYKIIVAYADPEYGHIGIVYQATNWIYTGTTRRSYSVLIDGKIYHQRTATRKYGSIEQAKALGGVSISHPPKHRYIYFLGSKKDRKLLRKRLPWDVKEYPK